jgi:phosphoglycerate dehydrogenase-like enzyme
MINAESLSRMKRGVILLNLGRGDLINTDDLIAALQSGQIGGAGLDVTNPEPIPMDSPLLAMNNVIINPHIASASESAVRTLRNTAAQLVAERHSGRPLRNVMNGISS